MSRSHRGWRAGIRRLPGRTPPPASNARIPAEPPLATPAKTPDELLGEAVRAFREMRASTGRFRCARDGTEAAVVKLYRGYSQGSELIVESGTGRAWHRLETPADEPLFGDPVAEQLQEVLAAADAIGLHLLNPRWTPFFCASCAKAYCGDCWRTEEVFDADAPDWPREIRAICPEGHVSRLA
jgi:hypothetical protein